MGIRKPLWAHLTANKKAEKTDRFDLAVVKNEVSETYNYILIELQKITTDEYDTYENEKLFDIIDFYNKFAIDVLDIDVTDLRIKIESKILEFFDSGLLKDIIGDEELDISRKTKFINIIDCIKNIDTKNKIIWPMKDRNHTTTSIVEILTDKNTYSYSPKHELYEPHRTLVSKVENMFTEAVKPSIAESFLEDSSNDGSTDTDSPLTTSRSTTDSDSRPSTARSFDSDSRPSTARSFDSPSPSPSLSPSPSPSPLVPSDDRLVNTTLKIKPNAMKSKISSKIWALGGKKSRRKPKKKKRTIRRRIRQ